MSKVYRVRCHNGKRVHGQLKLYLDIRKPRSGFRHVLFLLYVYTDLVASDWLSNKSLCGMVKLDHESIDFRLQTYKYEAFCNFASQATPTRIPTRQLATRWTFYFHFLPSH